MTRYIRNRSAGMIALFAAGRFSTFCAVVVALAACAPAREPLPVAPASESAAAAEAGRPLPEATPTVSASTSPGMAIAPAGVAQPPGPTFVVPAGAIYVCVSAPGGTPLHTGIAYEGKTDALCRRHPEMGVCQYERNACRRGGGRVYAADGTEITMATEAEYDRKVQRVQFKAN